GAVHDATRNSVGGAVSQTFSGYSEVDLGQGLFTYPGDTWGGELLWPRGLGRSVYSEVPASVAASLVGLDFLSFRMGEVADGSANPPKGNATIAVRLIDAAGHSAAVRVMRFAKLPPPFFAAPSFDKTVLGVVRIPLKAFRGVEPTSIRAVRFESL